MLPSLLAREIHSELKHFLHSAFPTANRVFQDAQGGALMERFLADPDHQGHLLKGPWLEVKLPFRSVAIADSPLEHISLPFSPYQHQLKAYERLASAQPQSTIVATGTGSG